MEYERDFIENLIYEIIHFYNLKHFPTMKKDKVWLVQEILTLKKDFEEAEKFHEQVFEGEREESEMISAQITCSSEDFFHDIIGCPFSHTPKQIKNYYDRVNTMKKKIWPTVFTKTLSSSSQYESNNK
jgi:hypothetical protein